MTEKGTSPSPAAEFEQKVKSLMLEAEKFVAAEPERWRSKWGDVYDRLQSARREVRSLMTREERHATMDLHV